MPLDDLIAALRPAKPDLHVHIRWLLIRDYAEVLAIARQSYSPYAAIGPLARKLRERNVIGMVAEAGDRIVGYMIYEIHDGHLMLLDLAVLPEARRRGMGRHLVNQMKGKLGTIRTRLVALPRESNLDGHLFLKAMGWKCLIVLAEYWEEVGEDAYQFEFSFS